MSPFRSQEELEQVLSALWEKIFATEEIVSAVADAKLVARFRYTDFPTVLYIDLQTTPPVFFWNPAKETPFDVEMILSSETSHKFWMQELNVPMAIAARKIIAKGSVPKALKLMPALKPAFPIYPKVLEEMGRSDLLERVKTKKRRRSIFHRWRWWARPSSFSLGNLPEVPLTVISETDAPKTERASSEKPVVAVRDLLRTMMTIRAFETHLSKAFSKGDLPTEAIHLSIGQEAVAAGVCLNLRQTDYLNTTHRGHGHIIAKGADLDRMMAEIYGKSEGLCRGKGGSMHVTDGSKGILGANGIVGAGYLLALGAGWSIKTLGKDDISVVIAGDGSVNQGMFHEAMNFISVFDLPVLVIVENNLYGEFTHIDRHSAVTEIHKRASAYGIESHRFDGNDVMDIFSHIGAIVARMRQDGRPRLVELMTYRWHGHMEGEGESYRTEEEKIRYKMQDPIAGLTRSLLEQDKFSQEDVGKIKEEVDTRIRDAVEFADRCQPPAASELLNDVFAGEPPVLIEGPIPPLATEDACVDTSMSRAINEALAEEMARDQRVFLWGEDVSLGGYFNVTEGLVDQYGHERIVDTPISENAIVGGAVGAALTGTRPVAEILFADFLTCCMDPLLNQAAKLRYMTGGQVDVPITIRTPVGSGIGMAAQHSQSMEKFFVGIPGLVVLAPSTPYTAKGLLKTAIRSQNPVLFFEHKLLYPNVGPVPRGDIVLPLGRAWVARQGTDVSLVSHLLGVGISMDVAEILAQSGISAEVIDLTCLYPLDNETLLESVAKTRHLVTIEEGVLTGGIGAELIARVATAGLGLLKAPPLRLGSPECPIPYAKNLEQLMLPDAQHIASTIERCLNA